MIKLKNEMIKDYIALMRFDKPVGIELVLWPTLWALTLGARVVLVDLSVWLCFILGAILMRAAGCVVNDFADRDFDHQVARTKSRPLATGKIPPKNALILFVVLCALSAQLLWFLPSSTYVWALAALALTVIYPFCKRATNLPQVVLAAAFGMAILMAYAAAGGVRAQAWLLFFAYMAWTVGYDTIYAITDRDDDIKAGIKSTARLFGRWALWAVGVFYAVFLGLLLCVTKIALDVPILLILLMGGSVLALLIYQLFLAKNGETHAAFLHNVWVGRVVMAFLLVFSITK